jgi:CheY-like chemotaxis protein
MKKLLLIEDDRDTTALLVGLLGSLGYGDGAVIHCGCMQEVYAVEAGKVGIVLTDLSLPDSATGRRMGGCRSCFRIRRS